MSIGITNFSNVSLENVTSIANISSPTEFFINVNHTIYGGWFYFILLWILWFILFKKAQDNEDMMLNNMMFASVIVSVISLILRGVYITTEGVTKGILTDFQLWIFPILTLVLALWSYSNKNGS